MSEAAYTHMDIVTILEDAKIDSHPQNDVDLGATQHATTTSEQFTIQGKSDTSFCMPLENVTDEILRPLPREVIPDQQPVLEPVNNALDIKAVSIHTT